jgi:hypothetical protein
MSSIERLMCQSLGWLLIIVGFMTSMASWGREGYEVHIAPYAWALDLDGTVGLNGLSVPLDLQSTELLKGAKSGGMGYLILDTPQGFFYLEGMQIDFAEKSFDAFFNQGVEATLLYGELGYGRHFDFDSLFRGTRQVRLSPYIGVRQVDLRVDVNGPLINQKVDSDWLDPVIGVALQTELSENFSLVGKADLSGLNLNKTDYRGIALAGVYRFSRHWSVGLGYRYASFEGTDDSGGALALDLTGQGPMVGLILSF